MIEETHAQVARDGVADGGSEPGLGHAEDRRQQEETDHRTDEPPQEPDVDAGAVGGEQCLIEDLLHDERGDDADRGSRDDHDAGQDDATEVGAEHRDDARAEVLDLGRLRVEALLGGDVDTAEGGATAHSPARCPAAEAAHAHGVTLSARADTTVAVEPRPRSLPQADVSPAPPPD